MDKSELKRLYDKTVKSGALHWKNKAGLDDAIVEMFGTHYSDHDENSIIDSIDYNSRGLDFETFFNIMKKLESETIKDKE